MRLATQKELEERKLNEIRDELVDKYHNQDMYETDIQFGIKQGFDAAVKLKDEEWEKRVAGLVKVLDKLIKSVPVSFKDPDYLIEAKQALADHKRMMEGE